MMDDLANPYASPGEVDDSADSEAAVEELSRPLRKRLEVGEVVVAWEKRRLWYNAVLAVVSAAILLHRFAIGDIASPQVFMLAVLAIPANACYCAGPIVEGYWTWLFGPNRWIRELLFLGGTLFSIFLAVMFTLYAQV